MRHMDAHLVRAPGLQAAFDQAGMAQRLDRAVMRDRALTPISGDHRHLLAVGVRPAQRRIDGAAGGHRAPGDDRDIAAVDAVRGELFGQPFVGAVVLRGDDQPAGILVDAVDDARTRNAPDPRQLPSAMVEQRVDHRPVKIARGGMDDHARGLVDDDQMFVLIGDDQAHVLGDIVRRFGGGDANFKRRR